VQLNSTGHEVRLARGESGQPGQRVRWGNVRHHHRPRAHRLKLHRLVPSFHVGLPAPTGWRGSQDWRIEAPAQGESSVVNIVLEPQRSNDLWVGAIRMPAVYQTRSALITVEPSRPRGPAVHSRANRSASTFRNPSGYRRRYSRAARRAPEASPRLELATALRNIASSTRASPAWLR
jgi:hypothetical protein